MSKQASEPDTAGGNTNTNTSAAAGFDYAVLIGRFQPFHIGHLALLQHALSISKRAIVVVGSDKKHRSYKNPFTLEERERMIRSTIDSNSNARTSIIGIPDAPYNDSVWIANIQNGVDSLIAADGNDISTATVALTGHLKDSSSYYLKLFPRWQFQPFGNVQSLNATDIRNLYFEPETRHRITADMVPAGTAQFLRTFAGTPHYAALTEERAFLLDYRQKYSYTGSDFRPIYTTVDAVVIEAGHILMVQRKFSPGKGTWALPGGFVGQNEKLLDAAIRELKEETKLKVPVPVLRGSLKGNHVFDDPGRSQRGRTITHAFFFELSHSQWGKLTAIRAADDAADAQWIPLSAFLQMQDRVYEDHFFIANHFLGALGALPQSPVSNTNTNTNAISGQVSSQKQW